MHFTLLAAVCGDRFFTSSYNSRCTLKLSKHSLRGTSLLTAILTKPLPELQLRTLFLLPTGVRFQQLRNVHTSFIYSLVILGGYHSIQPNYASDNNLSSYTLVTVL